MLGVNKNSAMMVAYNNHTHAKCVLTPCEETSKEQNQNGDWNGSDCQSKLDISLASHNDNKLHCEAQEEEKIKLQKSDVDLFAG